MSDKHPYAASSSVFQTISQLRKAFPPQVTSETLKKWMIASNNESKVISILRFLEILDDSGNKTTEASRIFSQHEDIVFGEQISTLIKKSYNDLFSLYGEDAWTLNQDKLIAYFRQNDESSAIVGKLQAATFQALSSVAGKLPITQAKPESPSPKKTRQKAKATPTENNTDLSTKNPPPYNGGNNHNERDFALTVRIEVNLPVSGDQETYDRIFRSIRENLLNGE